MQEELELAAPRILARLRRIFDEFVLRLAGDLSTPAAFASTRTEDGLLQAHVTLGYAAGATNAAERRGRTRTQVTVDRDSEPVKALLRDAYAALTKNGRARFATDDLDKMKVTIADAMRAGLSPAETLGRVEEAVGDYERHILRRIVNTEMASAASAGNVAELAAGGVTHVVYHAGPYACATCRTHHGNVIAVGEAQPRVNLPPTHPHCYCTERPATRADLERAGIFAPANFADPTDDELAFFNPHHDAKGRFAPKHGSPIAAAPAGVKPIARPSFKQESPAYKKEMGKAHSAGVAAKTAHATAKKSGAHAAHQNAVDKCKVAVGQHSAAASLTDNPDLLDFHQNRIDLYKGFQSEHEAAIAKIGGVTPPPPGGRKRPPEPKPPPSGTNNEERGSEAHAKVLAVERRYQRELTDATLEYERAERARQRVPISEPWEGPVRRAARDALVAAGKRKYALEQQVKREAFEALKVKNPSTLAPNARRKSMLSKKLDDGYALYNHLVADRPELRGTVGARAISGRAFARGRSINVSRHDSDTVILHELGHVLEHQDTRAKFAASDFLRRRTEGQPEKPMREWNKGQSYRHDERATKDDFWSAYVGKNYGETLATRPDPVTGRPRPGNQARVRNATEIMSMGLQRLVEDPIGFAKEDPDFFKFTVDVARGHYPDPLD